MDLPRSGPLAGLKVVELGGIGPVPFAGMYFADLGAEVLRVDRRDGGFAMPIPEELDTLHRGKQRITIDLKHPEGAEAVLRLAEIADVVLESYRPGVAERLGVGPEECQSRNPRLVYGRMTGWGQDGPMSQRAGHDPTYIALTGALHAIGRADGPPQLPLNLVGDFGGGGMYLVAGVLSALWEASRSGRGQVIDSAIVDGVAHLMASNYALLNGGAWSDRRGENLVDSGSPFVDVYETFDGKHVAVAALEPQFYAQLLTGLGLDQDSLPRQWDRNGWPMLRRTFAAMFSARTRDHWEKTFQGTDACVAPILSMTEAPHSEHLKHRRTFIERDGRFEPAPAPRFSRTVPAAPEAPVPAGAVPPETVLAHWGVRDSEEILTGGAIIKAPSLA
jgi:alpha-methylacyl-CoA racemase